MTFRLLLILGALSAFAPFAIDMYLPSFPSLARSFATDIEHVQLSLAVYFAGLASGQLFYGPLADRFGRRLPLLIGIGLFCLASLGCALAPSLPWLIAARFVQALGGCAGMVIARAVVRDLCEPMAAARAFSQIMLVTGIAPIIAPFAGSLLLSTFGWQAIFVSLALFAAACGTAVALWLPESLPAHHPRPPLRGALRNYLRLLRDSSFIGHTLTGGIAMAGMFAYISGSPFVLIELYGVAPEHYGWVFGLNAAGFILLGQLNARLVVRQGPAFWLRRAVVAYAAAGLVLLLVGAFQPKALPVLMIPLFCAIALLGGIVPNASACALAGQGANAGSASALMGSLQFILAALASSSVGALHNGTVVPMCAVLALCAVATALMARWTHRSTAA
ncbi:multidrug effflux MFS transporter [Pseudomonas sp. AS2.8]|uniref:multidrug effflux MFS transporter n=1 Tax=Pseudomonas sp. AS2.8 TaxID=2587128 RepID=UPI00161E38B2|nr:multidrug effflux MFS transporter [Pseudomonas sp. AS2.8]MBB2897214.1 DHA1 family bicyclomycin/chloramphenicol resistance-like MFS transporter [Pseudomonas sp. AS2.8]